MNPDRLSAVVLEHLPDGPIVVALGGGADSAVAAWAVAQHAETRGVFVRHGLIGSAQLEKSALDLGNSIGINVTIVDAPVDEGSSLEDRARRARWLAIESEAEDAETIVTGHTQDDQAETVLMNLLRGSGSAGIAGMLRSRPGVARPLMGISRADLREAAERLALPFVDDPANTDSSHLRNRIRLSLLPHLESDYRPGIRTVLARAGSLAAADDHMIEDLAADIPLVDDDGAVLVPSAVLATVDPAVASRAIRMALRRLLAPYAGSAADVMSVLGVADGKTDTATLTNGVVAIREGPYVAIVPARNALPQPETISVPSSIEFGGSPITFEFVDEAPVRRRSTLLVDAATLREDAVIRCPVEGDRIEIEAGSKTVRTVLSEHDVPIRHRSTWPVIAAGGRIAAIVGIRVAPWARPTASQAVAVTKERGRS